MWYDGYRTHISNGVTGAASFALIAGIQFDPATVMAFLDSWWEWVLVGIAGGHAAISWFRQLGKKKEVPAPEQNIGKMFGSK